MYIYYTLLGDGKIAISPDILIDEYSSPYEASLSAPTAGAGF